MTFIFNRFSRSLLAAFLAGASFGGAVASPKEMPRGEESQETIAAVQLFPMNAAYFKETAPELEILIDQLEKAYKHGEFNSIVVTGCASPDGPISLNRRLAQERAENIARFISAHSSIPQEKIMMESKVYGWNEVSDLVASMPDVSYSPVVIKIISENPLNPSPLLKKVKSGNVWKWLNSEIFPSQRSTDVTAFFNLTVADNKEQDAQELIAETHTIAESVCDEAESMSEIESKSTHEVAAIPEEWQRGLYVKTNLPAWVALLSNVAVEVDVAPHWSFTFPIYYSALNYFTSTLKFRTLAIQPEFRWWPSPRNHGFFAAAHFSMAYYNLAFNRSFRYQDHDGKTPAMGGGIALGWRFRLNSNPNLTMEATVGAGAYRMDYDVFYNRPGGLLYDRRKRTYIGLDQAALSLTYRFGIGKRYVMKGGGVCDSQ